MNSHTTLSMRITLRLERALRRRFRRITAWLDSIEDVEIPTDD